MPLHGRPGWPDSSRCRAVFCSQPSVPIAGFDGAALGDQLRDRHVVILDMPGVHGPSAHRAGVARFLSRLDTLGGRPHALVCRCLAPGSEATLALGPMRPAQLRRSVLCTGIDAARTERAVDKAVRQSAGWPGAFAVLVREWLGLRAPNEPYRFSRPAEAAVRETALQPRGRAESDAPAGDQASAMLARAGELAGRGRHAAAERLLRRTVGYLQRRQRAGDQARALLALGRLLLHEGPPASGPRGVRSRAGGSSTAPGTRPASCSRWFIWAPSTSTTACCRLRNPC